MSYKVAGIDVHKKTLAVVVADVEVEGAYEFERRRYGSNPEHLRQLAEWLIDQQVEEIVNQQVLVRNREHFIWRKPYRIVVGADARGIFPMRNVW